MFASVTVFTVTVAFRSAHGCHAPLPTSDAPIGRFCGAKERARGVGMWVREEVSNAHQQ